MSAVHRTGGGGSLYEPTPKSKSDFALRKFLANGILSKDLRKPTHYSKRLFYIQRLTQRNRTLRCSTPGSNAPNF